MHFTALDTSDLLADWLANHVAESLTKAIGRKGRASLAVSGGSTPKKFFKKLSGHNLEWEKVWITLVDERWVPQSSNRSNQRMITIELLQDKAANAHLVPLYRDDIEASEIAKIEPDLKPLLPFDVMILGMGTDGHTASLFPDGNNLELAASENCKALIMPMTAPTLDETRVTLTLPVIKQAAELLLHIEGKEKRAVLEEAEGILDPSIKPISFVLRSRPDIRVVWAP